MVMAEAQEFSQAAQHMKVSSCVTLANIPPVQASHVAKPNLSGPGKSVLTTPMSLEEKCQVPTGKHEQVTGAGQGSERPAPAGPMSQWETSFGPCLGGWEFHSIVEGWPEDPAGPRTRHGVNPPDEGSFTTYHDQM